MPTLEKQLAEIAGIPVRLDKLIERIERSNNTLASQVNGTMTRTAKEMSNITFKSDTPTVSIPQVLPGWMKWTIVFSIIIIALASISNVIYNIGFMSKKVPSEAAVVKIIDDTDSLKVISHNNENAPVDTMHIAP